MKISKRQLRRIIKEEKKKLTVESVADMSHYESVINRAGLEIAGYFAEDMRKLFWDSDAQDSDMFRDVEEGEWEDQVDAARQQLADAIAMAIEDEVVNTEGMLHGGEFMRNRR